MFKSEEGDIKMVLETTNNKNDEVNIDQYMIHGHEDAIGSSDSLQDESKDDRSRTLVIKFKSLFLKLVSMASRDILPFVVTKTTLINGFP